MFEKEFSSYSQNLKLKNLNMRNNHVRVRNRKAYNIFEIKLVVTFIILTLFNIEAKGFISKPQTGLGYNIIELERLCKKIELKKDMTFLYNGEGVGLKKEISKNKHLSRVPERVSDTIFVYKARKGESILDETAKNKSVKEKENSQWSLPIQQTVKGAVMDENEIPLPGVNIILQDTINEGSKGTTTDFDGVFEIEVDDAYQVLSFSLLGYKTRTFSVQDISDKLDVILEQDIGALDEVVISTGYQTISKERSTGSYGTISKEELDKPASTISERLVGQISGLQTTIDADGTMDFEVRGQTSLFADQKPLIVVDGFPIEGEFESINPNEVESITVLKDAAAASIWGAKSANGVIVVTTKDAAAGKPKINFSTFLKISPKLDLNYAVDHASAEDFLEYDQMAFDTENFNSAFGPPPGATVNELQSPISRAMIAMNEARLGRISSEERDEVLNLIRGLDNKSQIKDNLLQVPITNQYNLSISGGNETVKNRLSLLFETNKNYFKRNQKERYLIKYKNQVNIAKGLDFNFSGMMQYNSQKNNGSSLSELSSLAPWDMLKDEEGNLIDLSYLNFYKPNMDEFVPYEEFPYPDWSYNPIRDMEHRNFKTKNYNARIQGKLNWSIIDGLVVSSSLSYENFRTSIHNYSSDETFAVRDFVNRGSSWGFSGPVIPNIPSGGVLEQSKSSVESFDIRNQVKFNRIIDEVHEVDFLGGTEIQDRKLKSSDYPNAFGYDEETLSVSELLNPRSTSNMWNGDPLTFLPGFRTTTTTVFGEDRDRFFSLFGNLGYTFDSRYAVTGSIRTDASNLITDDPKYRYNPFWSVGAGWTLSNEEFMNQAQWVDRLKLRATLGANGNIDRSTSFKPLINLHSELNEYTHEPTGTISSFGNPTLRWEKTKTLNIGTEFSFWNNKLSGSFDFYHKGGSSLIVEQSIPAVNGTTSQKFNNGNMVNKGVEITLGTLWPIKSDDIVWSGNINYAYNDSKITKFFVDKYQSYDLYDGPTTSYVEGHDPNALWSYRYSGMVNEGDDENPIMKPTVFAGDGEEKVTLTQFAPGNAVDYMVDQGTLNAPHILSTRHNFKIYDFNFSFILTGKFGHVFRRQSFNYPAATGGNNLINSKYPEVANGNPEEIIPIPEAEQSYYFYDRFYPYMSYLTTNASHIRIQEINLTYTISSRVTDHIGFQKMQVFAQANNLGTILFNDFGEDPEYPKGNLKLAKSFTFGVNLNF